MCYIPSVKWPVAEHWISCALSILFVLGFSSLHCTEAAAAAPSLICLLALLLSLPRAFSPYSSLHLINDVDLYSVLLTTQNEFC